jgi:hypothetical protein
MKYEYKTTHGELYNAEDAIEPDSPKPPPGGDWEFINGTASSRRLYFFWRRIITKIV